MNELIDAHGRNVTYLRVSVTDRCNLSCRYCREKDMPFIPHESILRFEEMEDIIGLMAEMGVRKLRFTGGEPFVRKGFMDFLRRIRQKHPRLGLRITSNGTLLGPHIEALKELDAMMNISLDTLDRARFASITGKDLLPDVLENLRRMAALGVRLKVNTVAMRGQNDKELPALAALAMEHPLDVRFIEFMPMGEGSIWSESLFWPADEMLAAARRHWELIPCDEANRNAEERGPAKLWKLRDREGRLSAGRFGLISSVSHTFCTTCNRLRLTADGQIRTCLYDDGEWPVRDTLRTQGLEAVRRVILDAVASKPLGSEILARSKGPVAIKRMSAIGG
ncbi:GTP 3',8-cyclase MoaA [Mailhella sp.]|uniref:GTP 3',8-cyclase MoaA n=1 Tax=Mailhella sp. TaxID=1981029 RepID=UPI00406443AB